MAKVLVVEDEPTVVTVLRYHLESAGFEGLYAHGAAEGWRLLVSDEPDVAVIDIGLSDGDGWDLLEKIRSDGRFSAMPAIALTGKPLTEIEERLSKLNAEYMGKPFAATALLTRIRHLVHSRSHEAGAVPTESIRVELVAIGVVLLLDGYRIEGKVYLPPELGRFSDAWESVIRDHRNFVPVTEARVTTPDGSHTIASPAFIEVRKSDVRAVFPMDVFPGD